MKDCYDQRALSIRLNRVVGQINAIKRMLEDDHAKCEDIMIQINACAIVCSILGVLGPVSGALVHNFGSVLVVLNAALLYDRKFKPGARAGTDCGHPRRISADTRLTFES